MRGRITGLVALLLTGCVAPGASLDAADAAILDTIKIEGALASVLPNGDRLLAFQGETDTFEEYEFDVPAGTTYVEAVVRGTSDAPFLIGMANAGSRASVCMPQTWIGWNQVSEGERRCTAIAASDPGQRWLVRITNVQVPSLAAPEVAPFEAEITFSTAPLEGSAALLKLDALSKPTFAAAETFSEKIPASADGALLNVEITLPDAPGPFPTIMVASPYVTAGRAALGRAHDPLVQYWTARGYALVTMDLRGTGTSGGCYSARGAVDETDVADAVTWAAQQEWSTGKVGMVGFSYVGYTPVAAAVRQAEGLAAIYVGGAAIDMWSNYNPGGVNTGRTLSGIALGYAYGNAAQTTPDDNPIGPVQYTADAFCDPEIWLGNDPRALYDAWWAERNLTARASEIQVPVALEQGFWDNNVKANYVPDFFNALDVPKRALFGSWQHIWAYRADQSLRVLAWMDQWVKGVDTGIMDTPVVEVKTNTNLWRAADAWPEPTPTYAEFSIDDGALIALPPAAWDATESAILTSMGPALTEPLYWSGVGLATLDVSMPAGGVPLLEARLYEEKSDGTRLFAGVGWVNGAHLDTHTTFLPFAPGETRSVEMKLLPQDHVFQPGSILVFELRAASDQWGGIESGLTAPASLVIESGTLRLPTLPATLLTPAPRSAS